MRNTDLKDKILRYLLSQPSHSNNIENIATALKIEYNFCVILCDDIITKQLADRSDLPTPIKNKNLTLTPNGIHFLNEGGYKSFARKECWKKVANFILPTLAIFISGISLIATIFNQQDQNKKWQATNTADVELNEVKMLGFIDLSQKQMDTINWGYSPTFANLGGQCQLLNILTAKDSSLNRIIFTKSFFTLPQIITELKIKGYRSYYILRELRPSFLFQNIGQTPARNVIIKVEARTIDQPWILLNTLDVTKKLPLNMKTAVLGNYQIDIQKPAPDSINFRLHIEYSDIQEKTNRDTIYTKWLARDNQFYNSTEW